MNIWGIMPNTSAEVTQVKSANKSTTTVNQNGFSFSESLGQIARSANMQIAHGATASELQFMRKKEGFDKPFNPEDVEEEMLENYMTRIKKMMDELQK